MNEPSIRVMPKALAEQIAAGEVVERPASAAKELLENALDAGAKHITLELRRGGIEYLRVTDDGKGIPAEEVPTAFLRHATSKLYDESQLTAIATLGFRGEALAAIGAVARVEMLTKPRDALLGCRYVMENGETHEYERSGCPDGTTVIVRDLFAQVPARYKFLKKDSAEGSAIHAMVQRLALSHPEVSFRMLRDGKTILSTPGDGDWMSAIVSALDEKPGNLAPVRGRDDTYRLSGFLSRPSCCKGSRQGQFFFVNGRWVRSRILIAALENAYKNQKLVGRFPGCVVHLTLPYEEVDVNSHPAKTEVRFADEQRVYRLMYHAAQNALADAEDAPALEVARGGKTPGVNPLSETLRLASPSAAPWNGTLPAGGVVPPPARGRNPQGSHEFSTFPSMFSTSSSSDLRKTPPTTPSEGEKPGEFSTTSTPSVEVFHNSEGAAPDSGESGANAAPRPAGHSPRDFWAPPPARPAAQMSLLNGSAVSGGASAPADTQSAPIHTPSASNDGFATQKTGFTPPKTAFDPQKPALNPQKPAENPLEGGVCGEKPAQTFGKCGQSGDKPAQTFAKPAESVDEPSASAPLRHFPSPYITEEGREPWRVVCELFNTYIVVEQGENAIFIDKHAAHERLGFEQLKSRQWLPMSQELLQPQAITVSPQQKTVLLEQVGNLEDFGFIIQDFGQNTIVLRTIPNFLSVEEAPAALQELADEILTHGSADPRAARDSLLHSMACKAAMKAGQKNSPAELLAVARAVMAGTVKHCPHGRPVMTVLSKKDLEKGFKRIL